MSARDVLDAIKAGDYVAATSAFETAIAPKIEDRIEAQKPAIAAGFFGVSEETMLENFDTLTEDQLDEISQETKVSYLRKIAGVEKQSRAAGGLYWDNHHPRKQVAAAKAKHAKHFSRAQKLVQSGKIKLNKEELEIFGGE